MNLKHECIPCVTRQLIELAERVSEDVSQQRRIINYGLDIISKKAFQVSPPYLTGEIYAYARQVTGMEDPFACEKHQFNLIAQEMVKKYDLRGLIKHSDRPLETAIRLSIAGNIIDFSLGESIQAEDVRRSLEESLKQGLFGDRLEELLDAIEGHDDIMILGDNSGEIVFDQLLVEALVDKHVTYVVKGGPIVNDATMKDALAIGLDHQAQIMSTGVNFQGIILDRSDPAFVEALARAELVIAKGQANYETLNEYDHDNLYFLLRGKCQAVASVIGCPKGSFVCVKQGD